MFPINPIENRGGFQNGETLHSTMFPINRHYEAVINGTSNTLHSTMFPINPGTVQFLPDRLYHFTFHYVSY